MKKLLLAATAAAILAVPAAASAQEKVFALVPKAMNNPFFDLARDGCKQADKELADVECLYIGPGEHTEAEQVQIVQDLIARRVGAIAVSPSNAPAMARVAQRAKEAGIPVITWDADFLAKDTGLRSTFIGTKNYDIGVNLAKIAASMKPSGGTICLQSGGAAPANHNERLQGIRDTLAGASGTEPPGNRLTGQNGWTEVDGGVLYTDDDGAKAVQQLADILGKYRDLDVFISTGAFTQWSDNAYRQVVEKHKGRLDSQDLVVTVADTLPMQMQQLKDGLSHGQVGQRPYEMGYKSMYILKDMLEGKMPPDPIYTGLDVCTPDNADDCLSG